MRTGEPTNEPASDLERSTQPHLSLLILRASHARRVCRHRPGPKPIYEKLPLMHVDPELVYSKIPSLDMKTLNNMAESGLLGGYPNTCACCTPA